MTWSQLVMLKKNLINIGESFTGWFFFFCNFFYHPTPSVLFHSFSYFNYHVSSFFFFLTSRRINCDDCPVYRSTFFSITLGLWISNFRGIKNQLEGLLNQIAGPYPQSFCSLVMGSEARIKNFCFWYIPRWPHAADLGTTL